MDDSVRYHAKTLAHFGRLTLGPDAMREPPRGFKKNLVELA
jgi:hypothetical protein